MEYLMIFFNWEYTLFWTHPIQFILINIVLVPCILAGILIVAGILNHLDR